MKRNAQQQAEYQRKWRMSPEGKAWKKAYRNTQEYKDKMNAWRRTEEFKANRRKTRKHNPRPMPTPEQIEEREKKSKEYQKALYLARKDTKEYKDRMLYNRMKREYGLSKEQYDLLVENHKSRCAICNEHNDNLTHSLCIDHNHDTGKVRGLLCKKCNTMIGLANDDVELLQKGIAYLCSYSE